MSTPLVRGHLSSSTPPLDGKGDTDSAAKARKSTKRTGSGYGAPYLKNLTPWLQWPNLLIQCITVYTPNSVQLNQITPSTPTTVSLAAFPRNLLPLLIRWRLSSCPCADLRTFLSPTRPFFSHRSQAQYLKKTLPACLCSLLLVPVCPNKIRSR